MATIAECPNLKCRKPIEETHEYTWCSACGESLPTEIRDRLPRVAVLKAAAQSTSGAAAEDHDSSDDGTSLSSSPIVNRYRDTYRVGEGIVTIGNTIKVCGGIVFALAFIVSLNLGSFAIAGIFLGGIAGGLFWVFGVIVNSHGQTLIATVDTAVASSRFLTDVECAEAMRLPRAVIDRIRAAR